MSDILNQLRNVLFEVNSLKAQKNTLVSGMEKLNSQIAEAEQKLKSIIEAREYYKRAVDLVYNNSVKDLENTVNAALSYVFTDRNFRLGIELSDKRGKSLSLVMYDNNEVVSLKDGMGMGINCVISAILHLYYLNCKGSKILMLDEAYYNMSEEYVGKFFEFFLKLVNKLEFTVIMITHSAEIIKYCDRVYLVDNGEITCA